MENISFEEFKKVEIKIGKIMSAEKVEGSEKLLKLEVDFNETKRQIVAGIGKFYAPETLVGKECPFVFNLEPKTIIGTESQGMILCASGGDENPILLHPDKEIPPGSLVR